MLFDLEADPGEQVNLADQHPDIVNRLKQQFDEMEQEVQDFPAAPSDYLFRPPARGEARQLMHLIGGELRYDRVPEWQQHLIQTDD